MIMIIIMLIDFKMNYMKFSNTCIFLCKRDDNGFATILTYER